MKGSIGAVARDDILRQYRYLLVEEDNPAAAQRFLAAVHMAVRKICQRPGIGAPKLIKNQRLAGLRSWSIKGFTAIRIYYLVSGNSLRVIRVLHGKRDINPMLENESEEP
ncbi:MAG TPA: type II toxin-antitoxin system RelE/ParE family toxin [Candidatus Angelobacter sp.]|jgi:toxin ParE1/3/4